MGLNNQPTGYIDLMGIRLGLGRLDRQPLAYRIWCSRILGYLPDPVWKTYVKEYTMAQATEAFSDKVFGLDHILKWLANPLFVSLIDPNDP